MRQGSPSECSLGSTPRLVQVESFLIFVLKSNTQKVAPPVPGVLWQGFAKTLRICGFSIRHFPIGSICQIPRFTSCVVCNETVGVDPTSATPMFPSGRLWDGQPTLDVIPIWADRLLGADSNRKRCRRHTHTHNPFNGGSCHKLSGVPHDAYIPMETSTKSAVQPSKETYCGLTKSCIT